LALLVGQLGGQGCGDGIGPTARFNRPAGIARGSDGQLYVADGGCSTIRRFDPATGAVTTVAGTPDRSGLTDGRGAAAQFFAPEGLAADGAGNLFVADAENQTIRKIALATADVVTIAGAARMQGSQDGTGSQARFGYPRGIVADGAGNLFVSDLRNDDIRMINIATRQVSRLAGAAMSAGNVDGVGGAARFNNPSQLAADGAGNLYVADAGNSAIRRIELATAGVTTVVPSNVGSGGPLRDPAGIALDGAGRLLITEGYGVRAMDLSSGQITSVAGSNSVIDRGYQDGVGAAAHFYEVGHIFRDGPGHAYVSDGANSVVRAVDVTTGTVTTVAGRAAPRGHQDGVGGASILSYVSFIYADGQGNLYTTDLATNTVRKIVVATGEMTTVAGKPNVIGSSDGRGDAARFYGPAGITGDGMGNLYVADGDTNNTIRRIVLSTGDVTTIAGLAGSRGSADGVGTAARFNTLTGITCDGANLYITDQNSAVIRQMVLATREVTTLAGTPNMVGNVNGVGAAARFQKARALVYDGIGNLYIADSGNNAVRKLNVATRQVTTYAMGSTNPGFADGPLATANFYAPFDIAIDGSGHLYIADYGNLRIRRIDLGTQMVSTAVGTSTTGSGVILGPLSTARLNYPMAVAVLPGDAGVVLASERALLVARF
jgi:streptogramin lyase